MPHIGAITPACWLDPIPEFPDDRFTLLGDDGWADQSVLFYPERYGPVPIGMLLTAANLTEMTAKLASLRALRKTKVKVDDGMHTLDKCLVLAVRAGPAARCGMIVGGSSAADAWEQEVVAIVLPPSPAVA